MKSITSFICLLALLFHSNSFSQHTKKALTVPINYQSGADKKNKDSIEFEQFKKENPEAFSRKRMPIQLIDGNYLIVGHSANIELTGNIVIDSVEHNFYPGMPDTSTVIPFSAVKIGGKKIMINLFTHLPVSGLKKNDSASATVVDEDFVRDGKVGDMPISDFDATTTQVRISINGKFIFDWRSLESFSKQVFRVGEKYHSSLPTSTELYSYTYGYGISDTAIQINDQVLVEIKETQHNWMIDRFNIICAAVAPDIIYVNPDTKAAEKYIPDEKKISFYNHNPVR